jgi:mRNA interferase RelE/StbE
MSFKITYSDKFKKSYKKLTPKEQIQVKNKIELLIQNPFYPSLRTKKIKGTKFFYESSVNMSIRLIWHFEDELLILMIDVGQHDILKQF